MPLSEKPPLVAIVGPTAVGKSALALALASRWQGEIVSADSRQIYRYMDIGTAKPTAAEQRAARHHLIDVVAPDRVYTLAEYQADALAAIAAIQARGGLPLLVGGTGLYMRAALSGYAIPHVPPQPAVRRELEAYAAEHGADALHARLAGVDPAAAARIDARNIRRVVRALEVYEHTGRPISVQQAQAPGPFRVLTIGLTVPRPVLYQRIDERVDQMLAAGLVEETRALLAMGYGCELPALSGLGYRQVCAYLRGEMELPEAVALIKTRTHRFARQQYTWFRLDDSRIHWLAADATAAERAVELVERFLKEEITP
ncbi:MAG: tRNA (adenosine(37)-N6)-dimethylallyltransferase MiaA [Chloroflexota bacterium]